MDKMASRRFRCRFVTMHDLRDGIGWLELSVIPHLSGFLFRWAGGGLVCVANRFTQICHHKNLVSMDA